MVASTDPGWIHTAFDILTGLFDRVGLQTNVKKTVGMVFHTCRADRVRADKAYTQRMTWGGDTRRGGGSVCTAWIKGRIWQGGHWMRIATPITAWQKGGRGRRATRKAGSTSPGRSGWSFWQKQGQGPAQLRDIAAGWRRGWSCGCNSCTGTYMTPW